MTDAILPLGDISSMMNTVPSLGSRTAGTASVDAAAQDFEAMFATQLLQPMFDTVHVNDTFGGGHGEEVMRSFLMQEYGKMIAKSGKLGIASSVKAEMLRAQEAAKMRGATLPIAAQDAYNNANMKGASYVSN